MKKRLAQWFLLVAKRLDNNIVIDNYQYVKDYEPKKLGLTMEITKKDVRDFKNDNNLSEREARKEIVKQAKQKIRSIIINSIDRLSLIEFDVRKRGCGFDVSGDLKVNMPCRQEEQ